LENNVLKGQERPHLGISQRCDLERYSLDTVCQNTVRAKLCGYPPLLVCLPNQSINSKRFRTFGEMALDFVKNQISCFQFTSVVLDIFDRYDIQNSIKKAERDR
jgi:hypothetical protein